MPRTPSEALMNALENVEGAEQVVIITIKEGSLWWDSTKAGDSEPDIDEVMLVIQKTLHAMICKCLGLIEKEEDAS
jgi:hypothetical protein